MTEQEIKDILQQQNHFFSSGKTIQAEFRLKQLESLKEAMTVSYTHLRAHETDSYLVCRLLLEKKKKKKHKI